jgi:CheY-like chemotaxis protein
MKATCLRDAKINPRGRLRRFFGLGAGRHQLPAANEGPSDEESVLANPLGRALVVDDNPIILRTVARKLAPHGYAVTKAASCSEALSAIRKEKPDIVLLDVILPVEDAHGGTSGWDGFNIMGWLRRLETTRNIPVIIISGKETTRYREQALAAGALAFFPKPIDHDRLLSVINGSLRRGPRSAQAAEQLEFQI